MENHFYCPKCNGYLNVGDNIVFSVRTPGGDRGLILLHRELGNYDSTHNPGFNVTEGEKVDFFCAICHARLTSPRHDNLANVLMKNYEDQKSYEIVFSRLSGERCTYKVLNDHIESYGDDSNLYMQYFFLSQVK